MAKDKGGRPGRTYRKAQSQRGNPMWRDPAHAGGGNSGCPLSVLIMLVMVGAPVWGVVELLH